jgi:mono/diheme cytochrome c family protein
MARAVKVVLIGAAGVLLWTSGERLSAQAPTWEAPPEAKSIQRPAPADDAAATRGKRLYRQNCLPCHGETGKGEGPMGKAIGAHPGNLTDKARMGKHSDGEVYWKTAKGKLPMPAFEQKLNEKEIWDVVAYVRTFAK